MKRLKNILMSVTLSVCIVASSMPIEVLAKEAVPGQEESAAREHGLYEIVSFEELNEEVRNRSVPVGTALEDLSLPETLTVLCRPYTEKQDGEEETDRNPDDDSEDEENESGSGDESGEEGIESNPGDESEGEGNEGNPGDESEGEGSEGNPGDESEGEGSEGNPDDDTGEEGSEENPGGDTEDEGNEGTPGDDAGEGGSEGNPGGDTEDEGNEGESGGDNAGEEGSEGTPDGDTGEEGSESNPGEDSEDGETGNESGGDTDDGGNEDHSDDTSADEAVMEQTTVEVHMREYKSRPEIAAEPEILEPDGQEEESDSDLTEDQETESPSDQEQEEVQSAESVVIENITWQSTPAYDGNTEGSYIFMPVLPEEYVPGEGVALPEIAVTVGELLTSLSAKDAGTPACGTISTDTVWDNIGALEDGELIVEPGVTLTINERIHIVGNVTIKGGGTIKRGSALAYIYVTQSADLTIGEITLEGNFISGGGPMIKVSSAKILLDDGCQIQNCQASGWPASVMQVVGGKAVLNDVTIVNCNAVSRNDIGTIVLQNGSMTVNGGTYRDNKVKGVYAGSFVYSQWSKLYINGGSFINNIVDGSTLGGCILDLGQSGNETYIYNGYFEGNKSVSNQTSGGAIHYISRTEGGGSGGDVDENTVFELSGDVWFCGDGIDGSGTDGFFLDFFQFPRKIHVGAPITSPVYFYLKAQEGYVIAKGSDNGYILTEKDMKQVHFTDVGNSGKQWYAVLDKEKNEIRISEVKPPYGLYVYYLSNGATGKVEDSTEYASGADVTVKSADALSMEGHRFKAWNTKPDGTGTPYTPGSSFKITDDITLYAIFEESKSIDARFYSGDAGDKEVISTMLGEDADRVTITAPTLKDMDGWTKVGWDEKTGGYAGKISPGASLTISKDTSYYGVYKKDVTLSYDANGGKDADTPGSGNGECRANVHDEITYDIPTFSVAGDIDPSDPEYEFVGWNTKQDGKGDSYSENDIIKIAEDTTLYAIFVKPPYANFYSGKAGDCERKGTDMITGQVTAPRLKERSGWEAIGWDEDRTGYEGRIKPDSKLTLTDAEDNKPYYGVYEKKVTLSYQVSDNEYGVGNIPADSTQTRKAKVCETEILYDSGADSPDAFSFEIAPDPAMAGYEFMGWNTRADGKGVFYRKDDAERNRITIAEDTVLHGIFRKSLSATFFSGSAGEHVTVKSVFDDSDTAGTPTGTLTTPEPKEMEGWEPVGWSKSETGYGESVETEGGKEITISEDTVYYGIYKKNVELSYDTNGWMDSSLDRQSKFRYANVHSEVTFTPPAEFVVGQDIRREGYSFLGWSLSKDADGGAGVCYGPEDTITLEDSATLYAQMVDNIAPVLGEAIYNSGYHNVGDWVVRKKNLEITVPVTEKGSGVNKIVYTFTPEGGEPVTGEALMEDAGESGQTRRSEEVWLEAGDGETSDGRADAAMAGRTSAADAKNRAADGEVGITDGEIRAKITISEDYKGTVSLKCRDNAGNESPLKLLTARGGGVIVEDNAPLIRFRHKENKNGKAVVEVTVQDDADEDDNSRVTGGIASVSWQTDQKQAQSVTDKGFAEGIVKTCTFDVEVSGAGGHTIKVTAVDNAGNESSLSTTVKIAGNIVSGGTQKKTTVIKTYAPPAVKGGTAVESSAIVPLVEVRGSEEPVPVEKEPKTGDELPRVEIYATIAMISGLSYVALYFIAEPGGMTEAEKNEVVARLIAWAKRGRKLRRYVALAVIFCVLVYYHGIGKRSAYNLKNIRMTHGQNRIEASRYEARQ